MSAIRSPKLSFWAASNSLFNASRMYGILVGACMHNEWIESGGFITRASEQVGNESLYRKVAMFL